MKLLISVIFLFVSQGEASSGKHIPESPGAPNLSAAQMLNWEQFKILPVEKKIEYFEVIKQFLLEQEAKWPGQKVANISNLMFPEAEASDLSCPELGPTLPQKIKDQIDRNGNACIKAGYLICVTYTGGTLKCSNGDSVYFNNSKKYCKDPLKEVACSPPLFIGPDSKAICVERADSIRLKSVTQACINKQKGFGMDVATYKGLVLLNSKTDKFKPDYESLKKSILSYCDPAHGKRWSYDDRDCAKLTEQLAKIDPDVDGMAKTWAKRMAKSEVAAAKKAEPEAQGLVANAVVKCDSKYKIPASKDIKDDKDQEIKLQLKETADKKFVLAAQNREGWLRSECDRYGRIESHQDLAALKNLIGHEGASVETTPPQENNYQPCMVKITENEIETLHFQGISENDTSECGIHLTRYQEGKVDGADSKCSVSPIDNFNLQVKNDDSGVFALVSGEKQTGALLKNVEPGPSYYQVPREKGGPLRTLFYTPATKDDKGVCYASVKEVIAPQTVAVSVAAPLAEAPAEKNTEKKSEK